MALRNLVFCLAICVTSAPRPAAAFAVKLHEAFPALCLEEELLDSRLDGATESDLSAFRAWLHALGTRAGGAPFTQRYPTLASFDARALRELLSLAGDPERRIWGFDRTNPAPGQRLGDVLSAAGGQPDTDKRNQSRFAYDAAGEPVLDRHGRKIPFDPAALNMGNREGLSSQAHAHDGLLPGPYTDDPEVLKTDPPRFAVNAGWPGAPVITTAREMAASHVELALLARAWGGHGAQWLEAVLAGAGLHFVEDVANQIHTVQIGLYDFFVAAKLQFWKRSLLTGGGYLGELRAWTTVGVDILRNHHVGSERILKAEVLAALAGGAASPAIQGALATFRTDDPDLLDGFACGPDFAVRLTDRIIRASAPEGSELYRLSAEILIPDLRTYGVRLPDDDHNMVPWMRDLADSATRASLDAMLALQAKGFPRIGTALRAYMGCLRDDTRTAPEIMRSLLDRQLPALAAAEARRAAYLADPPEDAADSIRSPGWLLGEVGALALVFAAILAWRRRRKATEARL